MSHLQGKFVWFEHLSADPAAAAAFYQPLFGWQTEAMPIGEQRYSMVMNGGEGIGGYRDAPPGVPSNWLSYVSGDNVEASHEAALDAGATSRMAPMAMGPIGRFAVVTDPTGATLALWTSADADRPDVTPAPVGSFCWTELWTGDEKAALAFYERTIGYTHTSMDMGPAGMYQVLSRGGQQRAGVMRSTEAAAPPRWLPYVAVADADATAARATGLGAKRVVPPTDIPEVGRFSVLLDPQGAAFGIIRLDDAHP